MLRSSQPYCLLLGVVGFAALQRTCRAAVCPCYVFSFFARADRRKLQTMCLPSGLTALGYRVVMDSIAAQNPATHSSLVKRWRLGSAPFLKCHSGKLSLLWKPFAVSATTETMLRKTTKKSSVRIAARR